MAFVHNHTTIDVAAARAYWNERIEQTIVRIGQGDIELSLQLSEAKDLLSALEAAIAEGDRLEAQHA